MDILKDLTPTAVLSMDERALRTFVNDLNRFYYKNYHAEKELTQLRINHDELLWDRKNNNEQNIVGKQNSDLCQKKETVLDKIIFILKLEDRFLTSKEILELLNKYDPNLVYRWAYPPGALSQNLNLAVNRYQRIKNEIINGKKEHYYGLKSFYEENGKLKEKYKEQFD